MTAWIDAREVLERSDLERRRTMKWLVEGNHESDWLILSTLAGCRTTNLCKSPACDYCRARFQRWATRKASAALQEHAKYAILSIVPSVLTADDKMLTREMTRAPDLVVRLLESAGFTWAIGGIDLSFNADRAHRYRPHWQPHAWVFVPAAEAQSGKTLLASMLDRTRSVKKPLYVRSFDGQRHALPYAYKWNFGMRETFQGAAAAHITRFRELSKPQRIKLARALSKTRMMDRVIQIGTDVFKIPAE